MKIFYIDSNNENIQTSSLYDILYTEMLLIQLMKHRSVLLDDDPSHRIIPMYERKNQIL